MIGRYGAKASILALAALLPLQASAAEPESRATAIGTVEVARAVGTGIAFDLLTEAITAVFLTGESNRWVSVMSSASGGELIARFPQTGVLSTTIISAGPLTNGAFDFTEVAAVDQLSLSKKQPAMLALAQFN